MPLSSDNIYMCLKIVALPMKGLTQFNLKKVIGFVVFSILLEEYNRSSSVTQFRRKYNPARLSLGDVYVYT